MSSWEAIGKSDEWMTPKYIFDALGVYFDLDVAAPIYGPVHVPTQAWISEDSLPKDWSGFIWMNPPYGGRNALMPWVERFLDHGNGISLLPDRTSAPWFSPIGERADAVLFVSKKIKFERPDGSIGSSPGNGSVLVASGKDAAAAVTRASGVIGWAMTPVRGGGE